MRVRPCLVACLVALAAFIRAPVGQAQEDPWFGKDKAMHFGASAALAVGGYTIGAVVFEDRNAALASGAGLALSAGIGKEVYDAAGHGTASGRDLVWDVAGTATGLAVAWLFDRLVLGDGSSADVPSSSPTTATVTGREIHLSVRF